MIEFSKKGFDSNAFLTTATAAGYITPEIWSTKIFEAEKNKLVVAPLMIMNNELMGKAGDTLHLEIDAEIAATSVAETAAVSIAPITYTQKNITCSEQGVAVEASKNVLEDSLLSTLSSKATLLGYGLAKRKDNLIITALTSGAGNAVTANGVAATAIASSDTLDIDDMINAWQSLTADNVTPKYWVLSSEQVAQLMKNDSHFFIDASTYGSSEVRMNGEVGKFLGAKVFVSEQVKGASNVCTGFLLGDEALVIAQKRNPTFEVDYDPLYRKYLLVATERYGYSVLKANHICTIKSYSATA